MKLLKVLGIAMLLSSHFSATAHALTPGGGKGLDQNAVVQALQNLIQGQNDRAQIEQFLRQWLQNEEHRFQEQQQFIEQMSRLQGSQNKIDEKESHLNDLMMASIREFLDLVRQFLDCYRDDPGRAAEIMNRAKQNRQQFLELLQQWRECQIGKEEDDDEEEDIRQETIQSFREELAGLEELRQQAVERSTRVQQQIQELENQDQEKLSKTDTERLSLLRSLQQLTEQELLLNRRLQQTLSQAIDDLEYEVDDTTEKGQEICCQMAERADKLIPLIDQLRSLICAIQVQIQLRERRLRVLAGE